MGLSRVQGTGQFLLRSVIPAVVYILAESFLTIRLTLQRGEEIYYPRKVIMLFLGAWLLSLILCAIANHLPWRTFPRALVLWILLFVVRGLNLMLEWYFFSTEGPQTVVRSGIALAITFLVLALVVALLFPPARPEGSLGVSLKSLLAQRGWFSWAWRMAVGVVTYVFVYFVFGGIAFQFTRPYYTDPAYGLNLTLPSPGVVFKLQFVRGFIFLLASLPVLSGLRMSKRRQAWLLGMAFFILGGLSPLVSAEEWPVALRFYHTVEIFFQNFTAGAVLALLLGVGPSHDSSPGADPLAV